MASTALQTHNVNRLIPSDLQHIVPDRPMADELDAIQQGLNATIKRIPSKYFYDDVGSELFDQICRTPEYYPTRTESVLLEQYAGDILQQIKPDHIIEFGSGTSQKTRYFFTAAEQIGSTDINYWPFEVCEPLVVDVAQQLHQDYPWLKVHPLSGDYTGGLGHFPDIPGTRLFLFIGGTLGNFDAAATDDFLQQVRHLMRPGDALLLGLDRVKQPEIIEAAYNDQQQITAAFNQNILTVINQQFDADFDVSLFRHRAVFNEQAEQIEMYLSAEQPQSVQLNKLDLQIDLQPNEPILTEISRKFSQGAMHKLLDTNGFRWLQNYESQGKNLYSLALIAADGR